MNHDVHHRRCVDTQLGDVFDPKAVNRIDDQGAVSSVSLSHVYKHITV